MDKLLAKQLEDGNCSEPSGVGTGGSISEEEVSQEVACLPSSAPLGLRLAAFAVDTIISGLPIAFVTSAYFLLPLITVFPHVILQYPIRIGEGALVGGRVSLLFYTGYHPLCLVLLGGQTVGKRIFGLRVVKRDGSPLATGAVLARELMGRTILNTLTLGLTGVVSFVWALLSEERRTVHDEIGGTRVIVAKRIDGLKSTSILE